MVSWLQCLHKTAWSCCIATIPYGCLLSHISFQIVFYYFLVMHIYYSRNKYRYLIFSLQNNLWNKFEKEVHCTCSKENIVNFQIFFSYFCVIRQHLCRPLVYNTNNHIDCPFPFKIYSFCFHFGAILHVVSPQKVEFFIH